MRRENTVFAWQPRGPIAHRYPGELELSERAGQAGAHFSVIEENVAMVIPRPGLFLCAALVASVALRAQSATPMNQGGLEIQPLKAEQLFALANEARASAGVKKLEWDPALAAAAVRHCMRMASEVSIAHRYDGEPDLTERAGRASAHFSLIEENIAVGSYPATIHQGWLDSTEHRVNMLNPVVDRVGIAVVASQGVIFAVADFTLAVPVLTQAQG